MPTKSQLAVAFSRYIARYHAAEPPEVLYDKPRLDSGFSSSNHCTDSSMDNNPRSDDEGKDRS